MLSRPVAFALCALMALLALPLALQFVVADSVFGDVAATMPAASPCEQFRLVSGALMFEGALLAASAVCLLPEGCLRRHRWMPTAIVGLGLVLPLVAAFAYVRGWT